MEDTKSRATLQNPPNINILMASLQGKLKEVGRMTPNWSIYRVPKRLRQQNPEAYTPHFISIGPFHHKREGLTEMDEHKWRYMLSLLRRVGRQNDLIEEPLQSFAQAILNAEMEVRDWYAGTINLLPDELVKVLLLDSCFILELFFRDSERGLSEKVQNDPIFQSEWVMSALRRDLTLLENQIPFFVLKRLFYIVVENDTIFRVDYLPIMAFNFFRPALESKETPLQLLEGDGNSHECKHLLDLLLICHLPWPPRTRRAQGKGPKTRSESNTSAGGVTLHNVKALIANGVTIRKAETHNLFDVKFVDGVLHIPFLHIHEWKDSLFRNLVAFEHCCPGNNNTDIAQCMVSYIVLMNRLIDTREDVELLKEKGIITVELEGSEDVTNFFKDICKQVIVKDFYFAEVCEDVEIYYRSKLRGYLWEFINKHLKNPLTIASLIIATVFLGCTILQAVYTIIRGVSKDHKS